MLNGIAISGASSFGGGSVIVVGLLLVCEVIQLRNYFLSFVLGPCIISYQSFFIIQFFFIVQIFVNWVLRCDLLRGAFSACAFALCLHYHGSLEVEFGRIHLGESVVNVGLLAFGLLPVRCALRELFCCLFWLRLLSRRVHRSADCFCWGLPFVRLSHRI
jgi:hypothetical protein